ncbi:MAG: GNAT family protein [Candidatus Marinimicrobia bacterium]|nr:GNAT family protein [Candidatus Neomarinimicrobiota bacterium]
MKDNKIFLDGKLVTLTNPDERHASFFYELASDEKLRFFSSDEPFRKLMHKEFVYNYLKYIMPLTEYYMPFVILENETGRPVGQIHAGHIDHDNHNCMIGFEIHPHFQRHGYGNDAVKTLLDYLFFDIKLHRVGAEVYEYNIASQKLLEKVGFVLEGRLVQWLYRKERYWDKLLYGVLQAEWIDSAKND